jgi:hypothetical protein
MAMGTQGYAFVFYKTGAREFILVFMELKRIKVDWG